MTLKICAITILALASGAHALTINTPASAVECQPLQLTWSNGSAPYYLAVIPGGDTTTTLENLPTQSSGSSYTWTCDIASGTSIGFRVTDSTGLIAYTDSITVQSGSDTSCVGNSSSSSSGSAAAVVSSASSSSGSAAAAASSSSTSSKASSTTKTSTSSGSTASSSAAGSNNAATTSSTSGASSTFQLSAVVSGLAGLGVFSFFML